MKNPDNSVAAPAHAAGPSVGRLLLGVATLTGERLHLIGPDQAPAAALMVGLVEDGRDAATRLAGDMARETRRAVPVEKVRELVGHAITRGHRTLNATRDEANTWLAEALHRPANWATQTAIPQVVDDVTPYMAREVMPKLIDAMMPQIRETVVPAMIDDLTTDPRVRIMIAEQSHGAVGAAADELRKATSNADDQLESAFHRTFNRRHVP